VEYVKDTWFKGLIEKNAKEENNKTWSFLEQIVLEENEKFKSQKKLL